MRYADKLKDPRWQRVRLKVFERDNWTCLLCDATEKTLHAHHLNYAGEPWEAPLEDITTLCEDCHRNLHNIEEEQPATIEGVASLICKQIASSMGGRSDGRQPPSFQQARNHLLARNPAMPASVLELSVRGWFHTMRSNGFRDKNHVLIEDMLPNLQQYAHAVWRKMLLR